MSEIKLNFQDTAIAFADKSNSDLKKRYWLFRMMNSETMNSFGTKMAELSLSWHLPVQWAIKATVFNHFCGGETIEECEKTINKLGASHIGTILDYSVEGKSAEDFPALFS